LFFLIHHLVDRDELIVYWRHPGGWHAVWGLHLSLDSVLSSYYGVLHGLLTSLLPNYHLLALGYCPLSLGFCLVCHLCVCRYVHVRSSQKWICSTPFWYFVLSMYDSWTDCKQRSKKSNSTY
jgi:hypothetical protein